MEQIKEKINKARARIYIAGGQVLKRKYDFHVPTGDSDIQVVYDMTTCGLNADLWETYFWMPTVHNVLDFATHISLFGDVDAGYIYINYPINRAIRTFAGVDESWIEDMEETKG